MPAAAVIPAPIVYIKVVAVKKLVVELQGKENVHLPKLCEGWKQVKILDLKKLVNTFKRKRVVL